MSTLKSCITNYYYVVVVVLNKTGFLGLRRFSNVNVLNKSLLLQDWVFRLGDKAIKSLNFTTYPTLLAGPSG